MSTWKPYDGPKGGYDPVRRMMVDPMIVSSDGQDGWALSGDERQFVDAVTRAQLIDPVVVLRLLGHENPIVALKRLVDVALETLPEPVREFVLDHMKPKPVLHLRARVTVIPTRTRLGLLKLPHVERWDLNSGVFADEPGQKA